MAEHFINGAARYLLYISIVLPVITLIYGICKPGLIRHLPKMDGYIYRAYIVIIFCCSAQILGGLQDIVYAADTHVIFVAAISGICQNLMFLAILRCMNDCKHCGGEAESIPAPEEPQCTDKDFNL